MILKSEAIHWIPHKVERAKAFYPELTEFKFTTCLLCDLEQGINASGSFSTFEKWDDTSRKLVLGILEKEYI